MLNEARDREVQIREEFASILDSLDSGLPKGIDSSWFNEQNFLESFSVAVAHSIYLPSAQCFALVPFASFMARTGNDNGCEVDYETGNAQIASHKRTIILMIPSFVISEVSTSQVSVYIDDVEHNRRISMIRCK